MKLLVVAAWEPELEHLRSLLAAPLEASSGAPDVVLATIGVGVVEAAVGMMRCIHQHRPDLALLVGTAGAFGTATIGQVVVGASVHLLEASLLEGKASLPPPMPSDAVLDVAVHDALVAAGGRSVQIANTIGITVDDELAERLASRGDHVEHLEAFGFARACAAEGLRGGIALGVANAVGARGRAEWLANHVSASASAAVLIARALLELAAVVRTTTTARSPERA